MTILIANLGNSDLSIRPEGESYYLPIGFADRNEPNLEKPPAGTEEAEIWESRDFLICEQFCRAFGVHFDEKLRFSFRDFTERIWEAYQANPEEWHDRIRPGRIWGVVKTAQEQFGVQQIHVFVTDQPHEGDTIYTFRILKQWFAKEMPDLELTGEELPKTIRANDQDALFDYYYQFFNAVSHNHGDDTEILISIKGGTPQMQMALRMQAMASTVRFQANLEPQMSVTTVLAGEPSPCKAGIYWQYAKSQKYQAVKILLNTRWDFDGAEQLLQDWQSFLKQIVERNLADQEILVGNQQLQPIISALQVAKDCLNLDYGSARKDRRISNFEPIGQMLQNNRYSKLLNLYTQCRILWELDQIANFLPRMSSFCEAVMHQMMSQFPGMRDCVDSRWKNVLQDRLEKQFGSALWNRFVESEREKNNRFRLYGYQGEYRADISTRYSKRNFAQALIDYQNDDTISQDWETLLADIEQLDYWADMRNQLIHSAEGISKAEMSNLYREIGLGKDKNSIRKKVKHESDRVTTKEKFRNSNEDKAVDPTRILMVMEQICRNPLLKLSAEECDRYIGQTAHYYLYSEIKEFVLQQLL